MKDFGYIAWIFVLANGITLLAMGVIGDHVRLACFAWLMMAAVTVGCRRWVWLATLLLASMITLLAVQHYRQHLFTEQLAGQRWLVEGNIVGVPEWQGQQWQFMLQIYRASGDLPVPMFVKCQWFYHYEPLHAGERWRLYVKLKPPHGLHNPGTFDYTRQLLRQQIHATGYVVTSQHNQRLQAASTQNIDAWREYIATRLSSGRLAALIVGLQQRLTKNDWQIMQATGTSHLMAISGLHIGIVSAALYACMNALWRFSPTLMLCLPAQVAASVMGMLGGAWYAALAGFAVPTQRAVIMLGCVIVARVMRLHTKLVNSLALALLIVLCCDPLASLTPSLWLSFGAVLALALALPPTMGATGWRATFRTQVVVTIALVPLTLLFFQQTSLVSLPANAVAIPVVTLLIVPIALMGVVLLFIPPLAQLCFTVADGILTALFQGLAYAAAVPYAQLRLWPLPEWSLLLLTLAVCYLLLPRGWPERYLAGFLLVPLWCYHPERVPPQTAWVTILDVGQGLSVVVETAQHTLLFDAGPAYPNSFNAGDAVILPYLRTRGISLLDAVVISHGDLDHRGGLEAVAQAIPITMLLTSEPSRLTPVVASECRAGSAWYWDGVLFRLLGPLPDPDSAQGNNHSCVLQISVGDQSLLLPGDIEMKAERQLSDYWSRHLASTVLLAGHHGSRTSSSPEFVDVVQPSTVVYATGYLNRFHFPANSVMARYQERGVLQMNTAEVGAIRCVFKKGASLPAAHPCKPVSRSPS